MTHQYYDPMTFSRRVPWLVRAQMLVGGFANQFGWGFLGFGLIFVWTFGLMADFSGLLLAVGGAETAVGEVTAVESTNATVNEEPVYANHFTFRIERLEQTYQGVSYSTGRTLEPGWPVTIEYLPARPNISRIEGQRQGQFPVWVLLIVLPFPLIGLGFIIAGLTNGLKSARLLSGGKIAQGKLIAKEPTNTRINNQMVYKLTFEFIADDGLPYTVSSRTHLPYALEDEPQERLLYNPRQPQRAVMLDNLPGSPAFDDFGDIYPANLKSAVLPFILPAATILVHSTVFLGVVAAALR